MRGGDRATSAGVELAVVAAYVAGGCYALWPVFDGLLHGQLYGSDTATSAWSLWWMKESLLHLRNPWHTTAMFAPDGTWLAYHALAPLLGILWLPFTLTLEPALAVTLLSLAIPMAAAYATYRLGRALGFERFVAFATGAFFGFAPITLGRAAVHVMFGATMVFLPLALLASIRLHRRRTPGAAAWLGAALAGAVLTDPLVALLVAALAGLYWLGVAWCAGRLPDAAAIRLGAVAMATMLVLASPQLLASRAASRTKQHQANAVQVARCYRTFGTDVLAMIRPGPAAHFPAAWNDWIERHFARGLDVPATTGIAVFVLGLVGLVGRWRTPRVRWAALVWLVAFVFALGPRVAVGAHPTDYEHVGWTPWPILVHQQPLSALLPYTWLVQLPGMADFRAAQRFCMLAALPSALLAGHGLAWLLARRRAATTAAALLLVGVAVLEMSIPTHIDGFVPRERPAVYDPIRADASGSIVVDVPLGWMTAIGCAGARGYRMEPLLRATQHGHPIAYGFTNRLSDRRFYQLAERPFYVGLMARQYDDSGGLPPWPTPAPPKPPTIERARTSRERLHVGWAVVWSDASPHVLDYLRDTGFTFSHAADGFQVWRAPVP